MSTEKLIGMVIVGLLAWQHQVAIGSQFEPVANLVPRVRSYVEMRRYVAELQKYVEDNGTAPGNLSAWIDERFLPQGERPASQDPFGNAYRVDRDRELGWVLRSCGPDALCLTEDDLLKPLGSGE